jgi:hypothetical protein
MIRTGDEFLFTSAGFRMNRIFSLVLILCLSTASGHASDLQEMKQGIQTKISQANHCESKEDCALEYFPCPFGCYHYINKAESAQIRRNIEEYVRLSPMQCEYDCPKINPVNPICVDQKCVADSILISKEHALELADKFIHYQKIDLSKFRYSDTQYFPAQKSWVVIYTPLEEYIGGGRLIVYVNQMTGKVFLSPDD